MRRQILFSLLAAALASPALAADERGQLGQIGGAIKRVDQFKDLQMTDAEEAELGALVSEKVRVRYGVVQDPKLHRYVALVGSALASASSRPNLPWTFIVLDTDAVNAFAAPGGYLHITRGALALLESEAELAGVLAHEIIHVTEKHTIRAIQKSKAVQMGANETLSGSAGLKERAANAVYSNIIENGFGRAEENESDEKGIALVNATGYAPQGLGAFLTRLQQRNKDSKEKRGLFASHPEMKERLERLTKQITKDKLTASATLADRYRSFISYKPVAMTEIAVIEPGTAGLTGGEKPAEKPEEKKAEEPPKKRSGLGGLGRMLPAGGGEKKSAQVTSSASARGVDPERDAKGGSNPKPVPVKIAAADVAAFKKEGGLR